MKTNRTCSFGVFALSILYSAAAQTECITVPTAQIIRSSAAVFSGTLTGLSPTGSPAVALATFDVDTYWKGDAHRQITLAQFSSIDSPVLVLHQRYLVFTYRPSDAERSNFGITLPAEAIAGCKATVPLEEASKKGTLRELGRGRQPR